MSKCCKRPRQAVQLSPYNGSSHCQHQALLGSSGAHFTFLTGPSNRKEPQETYRLWARPLLGLLQAGRHEQQDCSLVPSRHSGTPHQQSGGAIESRFTLTMGGAAHLRMDSNKAHDNNLLAVLQSNSYIHGHELVGLGIPDVHVDAVDDPVELAHVGCNSRVTADLDCVGGRHGGAHSRGPHGAPNQVGAKVQVVDCEHGAGVAGVAKGDGGCGPIVAVNHIRSAGG